MISSNIKPKKINKKTERKLLVQKLDHICRDIVLDRDIRCVCPPPTRGHSDVRQCGHLITRSKESVRWDLYNLSEQCGGCNILHEHVPHRYTNWFISKFGVLVYQDLVRRAEVVKKLQLYELQELLDQLKQIRQKQLQAVLAGEVYKPHYSQQDILSGAWKTL